MKISRKEISKIVEKILNEKSENLKTKLKNLTLKVDFDEKKELWDRAELYYKNKKFLTIESYESGYNDWDYKIENRFVFMNFIGESIIDQAI